MFESPHSVGGLHIHCNWLTKIVCMIVGEYEQIVVYKHYNVVRNGHDSFSFNFWWDIKSVIKSVQTKCIHDYIRD